MSNFRKSVPAPTIVGAGAPTPKKGLVNVIYIDDILTYPFRDSGNVRMLGNLILKAAAVVHTLYLTPSSQKASFEIEGDEDNEGFMKKFEAQHPGNSIEYNEFLQNGLGKGFVVVYGAGCGDSQGYIYGSPCNPMKIKGSFEDSKDGTKHIVIFEQSQKDRYVPGFYDGELGYASNYEAPAAAVDFLIANGPIIQLPSLDVTAAITAASIDQAHDTIISLIGGGGADPATLSSGAQGEVTVILKDDTTWVALENATISLKTYKAGAVTYLIEVSRA